MGTDTRKRLAFTGDETAAYIMKQINPDVVTAYPITPQTETVMKFSQYAADGEVDTELVTVESEHSAMSATIGAAAAGARAMTATSANGLALMWEIVYIASSARLPIVMELINRALSAPINIHCDHSDSMGARDASWIQIYSENNQEVYENTMMALRIAEHPDVQLPVMVCQDGFITSHSLEDVAVFTDEQVREFIGERKPVYNVLDIKKPITWGPLDLQDYYFEHKRQQAEAMRNSFKVIEEVHRDFEKFSGKRYDFIEEYKTDDAEAVIVAMSSVCGTIKYVIDELRAEGKKVGPYEIPMQPEPLLKEAQSGSFWSYMAGVAYQALTRYHVRGLVVNNYMTDLPIKKGLSSSAAICVLTARVYLLTTVTFLTKGSALTFRIAVIGRLKLAAFSHLKQCRSTPPIWTIRRKYSPVTGRSNSTFLSYPTHRRRANARGDAVACDKSPPRLSLK